MVWNEAEFVNPTVLDQVADMADNMHICITTGTPPLRSRCHVDSAIINLVQHIN